MSERKPGQMPLISTPGAWHPAPQPIDLDAVERDFEDQRYESGLALIAELRAARKVVEAARELLAHGNLGQTVDDEYREIDLFNALAEYEAKQS